MIKDYTRWSELSLLNPDINSGTGSGGIPAPGCAYSLLEWRTLHSAAYVTGRFCLFTSLFGRQGSVSHCLHNMLTSWYILQLLTCRASKRNKTNLQAAEFGQSQRQQSLSWTYSKFVKKTEAYKNAFCSNRRLKPRHLCPEVVVHGVLWSPCAQSQLAKAAWLLAAVPHRTEATTCLASAFECSSPMKLGKV